MLKATQCARPVHRLTAKTDPLRSRTKRTAPESAPRASSSSRTAKTAASDSHQFRAQPAIQTHPDSGIKRATAKPGLGWASDETKPERRAVPPTASNIANMSATRRKFRRIKAPIGSGFPELSGLV